MRRCMGICLTAALACEVCDCDEACSWDDDDCNPVS
jgi:hypothetical protein